MSEPARKREMITPEQLKKIWTVARTSGMPEERLRFIVRQISRQESTRALTKRQAIKVINVLEGQGVVPVSKNNDKVYRLITPGQVSFVKELVEEAGWDNDHLMSFVRKYYHRDKLRAITSYQAGALINILKKEKLKNQEAG